MIHENDYEYGMPYLIDAISATYQLKPIPDMIATQECCVAFHKTNHSGYTCKLEVVLGLPFDQAR